MTVQNEPIVFSTTLESTTYSLNCLCHINYSQFFNTSYSPTPLCYIVYETKSINICRHICLSTVHTKFMHFFLVKLAFIQTHTKTQHDLKTIKKCRKMGPIHVNNLTEKNIYQKRGQLMTPATYKKDTKFCFFSAFHFVCTEKKK